jgi:hypothetical protein
MMGRNGHTVIIGLIARDVANKALMIPTNLRVTPTNHRVSQTNRWLIPTDLGLTPAT